MPQACAADVAELSSDDDMLEEFSFPWTQPTALTSVQQLGAGSSSMEMVDAFSEDLFGMSEEDALVSITLDPAKLLGIENRVGSIEVGKDADFALFSRHPFDMYSLNVATWIEGVQVYDRSKEGTPNARP